MVTSEHAEVRERIIWEATKLFVSLGYRGISMREIAEAVGVSKANLYYHFEDKQDLFLAILRANLDEVDAVIQTSSGMQTAREQIGVFVRGIFERAPEQRAIIRLASHEMMHLSEDARDEFSRLYESKFVGRIAGLLEHGMASGELSPADPHLCTWVLLGMLYPFFYSSNPRDSGQTAQAIDLVLRIFFDGTAASGTA